MRPALLVLSVLSFATPAYAMSSLYIYPPSDVNSAILRIRTENTACLDVGIFMQPVEKDLPYGAGWHALATERTHVESASGADPYHQTPFSTDRYVHSSGFSYHVEYPADAFRSRVSLPPALAYEDSQGMNESRAPKHVDYGYAYGCQSSVLDAQETADEWFLYTGDVAALESVYIEVYDSMDGFFAEHSGTAKVLDVATSFGNGFHVRPTWTWNATYDAQSRDGTRTLLASTDVDAEHGMAGMFVSQGESQLRWTSPTGRIGVSCPNLSYAACWVARGRSDEHHFIEDGAGTWRFDLDADVARGHAKGALMWIDLPEP